jgi:hypothetical protein
MNPLESLVKRKNSFSAYIYMHKNVTVKCIKVSRNFLESRSYKLLCLLYVFFWVIPRRLNFISRRFGTLYLFHLHRQEGE